jgi:nucleotide-binding universal stress UspA family protein
MFKQILVPVDLTDRHTHAMDIAAELAGASAGTVTVLHVIELIAELSPEEGKEFYEQLEKKAQAHVAQLGAHLAGKGVTWKSDVVFGNRAAEILRYVKEKNTDLIVLTSHRIDLQHVTGGLGTLSHWIGMLAPCPVLLAK